MKKHHKQILNYLPHKVRVFRERCVGDILNLYSFNKYVNGVKYTEMKPFLRPMSDLDRLIEHNGEKFIPIGKLHYMYATTRKGNPTKAEYVLIKDRTSITTRKKNDNSFELFVTVRWDDPNNNDYRIMQKLFEWHFDIFGLIEEGYALDYNTMKDVIREERESRHNFAR